MTVQFAMGKNSQCKGFFVVKNDRGLHTRPSMEIVRCAASFKSKITLRYQRLEVDAKSILGILMLTAARGARVAVSAYGDDAEEAVLALVELSENCFNIKY